MFKNVLTLLVYIIIMKAFISLWKITRLELSLKEARTEKKNVKNMQYCMVSDLDDEFMQKRSSASYTVLLYTLETRQQL